MRARFDRRLARASFLASFLLHGGLLVAVGRYGFEPPSAQVFGGGGQGGMEVRIRWEDADPGGGNGSSGEVGALPPAPQLAARPPPEQARAPSPPPTPAGEAPEARPEPPPQPEVPAIADPTPAPEPAPEREPEPRPAIAAAADPDAGPDMGSRGSPVPSAPPGPVPAAPDGAGIPEPRYPASCRQLGHEGTVVVRVEVGADGRVSRVDIVKSAGCVELDRSASAALRESRFRPALRFGRPEASVVEQRIRFRLR